MLCEIYKWTLSGFNDHAFIEGRPWTVQIVLCMKVYVSGSFFFGSRESSPLGHDDEIVFGIVRSLMEVMFLFLFFWVNFGFPPNIEWTWLFQICVAVYCGHFQLHRHFSHWIGSKRVSCGLPYCKQRKIVISNLKLDFVSKTYHWKHKMVWRHDLRLAFKCDFWGMNLMYCINKEIITGFQVFPHPHMTCFFNKNLILFRFQNYLRVY